MHQQAALDQPVGRILNAPDATHVPYVVVLTADHGGYDRLTQGLSGAMYRKWEDGTPVTTGVYLSDPSVPMCLRYFDCPHRRREVAP